MALHHSYDYIRHTSLPANYDYRKYWRAGHGLVWTWEGQTKQKMGHLDEVLRVNRPEAAEDPRRGDVGCYAWFTLCDFLSRAGGPMEFSRTPSTQFHPSRGYLGGKPRSFLIFSTRSNPILAYRSSSTAFSHLPFSTNTCPYCLLFHSIDCCSNFGQRILLLLGFLQRRLS